MAGANQTWMAILGPDVKATGKASEDQLYTNQIAPTIMGILNLKADSKTMPGKAFDLKLP